jgi:hypothetical protein
MGEQQLPLRCASQCALVADVVDCVTRTTRFGLFIFGDVDFNV